MPSTSEILGGLTAIAESGVQVAIAWHALLASVLVAIALGWRPSSRSARMLMTLPMFSVAAFAFAFGNPFNGTVFTAGAIVLLVLGRSNAGGTIGGTKGWRAALGAFLVVFGWVYPHFLSGNPAMYLLLAPLGLVPCPTLSVLIGLVLLGDVSKPRAWVLTLAAMGLFYGSFGVFRLGVLLDLGLVAGACGLFFSALHADDWAVTYREPGDKRL